MKIVSALFLVLVAALGCFAIPRDPYPWLPSEKQFRLSGQNAYLSIAGVPLVVPLIALREHGIGYGIDDPKSVRDAYDAARAAFRTASSNPDAPMKLDQATLTMAVYGWSLETSRAMVVCEVLNRNWALSMCDDPWSPLRQALPHNSFTLINIRATDGFGGYTTVGGESRWDQVATMRFPQDGGPAVLCDAEVRALVRFCTAGMRLAGDLVAVWTVADGSDETSAEQAMRQGAAIAALFTFGLSDPEDIDALIDASCDLRRPGSRDRIKKPPICSG